MNQPGYSGSDLTRHHAMPWRWRGYTAMDLAKFYGLVAGLWFVCAAVMVRYGQLFEGVQDKPADYQQFVLNVSLWPLVFALPVILIFFWWLSGALVRYARWQLVDARRWRLFWMAILLIYSYVLFDPLDRIHRVMARQGLAPAPNLVEIFGNGLLVDGRLRPADELLFQFQWGYGLLWFLFYILLAALHWSYVSDGLREVWFHARRLRRYGVSILLGFRETARLAASAPVTRDYPRRQPQLPPTYRGVPRLNVSGLTAQEAEQIRTADSSGAISSPPGQPTVLFVDLGRYDFSPALAELRRSDGTPLLSFGGKWPAPQTRREDLVLPLGSGPAPSPGEGADV